MNAIPRLEAIYQSLLQGSLVMINNESDLLINDETQQLLNTEIPTPSQLYEMELILKISNIIYNNTDRSMCPLEDGVYDVLVVHYQNITGSYPVGAPPVKFESSDTKTEMDNTKVMYHKIEGWEDAFYYDDIFHNPYQPEDSIREMYIKDYLPTRRAARDTGHNYPELVGTLDKCKFVLNKQAKDAGVFDDANVAIFERDFIDKHLKMGIIKPDEKFFMVVELKYDGVSVEADVTDQVLSARSRGDTANDLATDMTPILEGYKFNRLYYNDGKKPDQIGMKFEAILTKDNLSRLSELKKKPYKNCRNAIAGIMSSLDSRIYRDLITLVPLATSIPDMFPTRVEEIEFMNTYYSTGQVLNYAVLYGDYKEILFKVKKFLEEAEYLRPMMPFMYDGIVVSYLDKSKIKALGRENSVNKWSIAIKFNPLKKQTKFLGYSFTVAQNGMITPMIHYLPVEFYGTIHTKSSGHSYQRFKNLNLAVGDIITVEYTNDVMPYVTKPDLEINRQNPNKPIEFITHCPCCGTELVFSDSGKTAKCPNLRCAERNTVRMGNFLAKTNFRDFSEQTTKLLGIDSVKALLEVASSESICKEVLGEVNGQKFRDRVKDLLDVSLYDYEIVGSLGFSSLALAKWRLIFKVITIQDLLNLPEEALREILLSIKGIGPESIETIITELPFFREDLITIINNFHILEFKNVKASKKIRFTGFRDSELVEYVKARYPGTDIGEGSVSKDTNILLVPSEGFTSTKTAKAVKDGITIVPVNEFRENMERFML